MNPHTRRRLRQQAEATRPEPVWIGFGIRHTDKRITVFCLLPSRQEAEASITKQLDGHDVTAVFNFTAPDGGKQLAWWLAENGIVKSEIQEIGRQLVEFIDQHRPAPATPEIPQEADDAEDQRPE